MSSANNKEYGDLEQTMWRRFQDAEAMPDPDVWARIDHALTMQENAKYKKRALFYRQLAAACFILFVLAGSALLLHFKQDQEHALLATTGQQPEVPATDDGASQNNITGNRATIAGTTTASSATGAPVATGTKGPALAGEIQGQVLAQVPPSGKALGSSTPANYRYGTNTANAASDEAGAKLAAISGSERANVTIGATTGALSENPVDGYVPAAQAIANVPDNYTSPTAVNPLLRRNATLGTYTADEKAAELLNLQKQEELVVALNQPAESNKEEKTVGSNSRWNVGMGFTSSYFSQNVNIPEQRLMSVQQGIGIMRHTGPTVSAETEENLLKAYEEFEENTQAASSYNVEARTGFRIGKRLKLLAGLGYSQNTSKTKTSYIVEQFLFNPRSNERNKLQPSTVFLPALHTFTTDSVSVVKVKEPFDVDYSYQMLSIPVGLQVEGNIGQKWFRYAMGTTAVNFLMQTTIKASNPEIASVSYGVTDDSPFRKVQFSGNLGLGIGKRINKAVSISMGPEFRSYFNSMLSNEKAVATQGRPYTIGLNMGVNYTLGAAQ